MEWSTSQKFKNQAVMTLETENILKIHNENQKQFYYPNKILD